MKKREFVTNLLYYIVPMVAIIPLSIWGLSRFEKSTYDCFFVVGESMQPSFAGQPENSTYGYSDSSKYAIDNIQHFDIVVCYYPFNGAVDYKTPYVRNQSEKLSTATLKVKRVIGLPGDELVLNNETFSITTTVNGERVTTTYGEGFEKVPFERKTPIAKRVANITLGDDEYFVMGDNWTEFGSIDCCNSYTSKPQPIYRENIDGVIFKISGYCTYDNCKHCASCKKIVDESAKKCNCGGTEFKYYDDIIEERPFEDGPVYLK